MEGDGRQEEERAGNVSGVVMLKSSLSLDVGWGCDCWGSWGLSPSPMMLMLVDTLYNPALLAESAPGPKH